MRKKILITGGCGFVGFNIAKELIQSSERVIIIDNLSRSGSKENLEKLRLLGKFDFYKKNVISKDFVNYVVSDNKPDFIIHLAGQVAMTTSIENPFQDFSINTIGTLNILEAVRNYSPKTAIIYSSTNKVYGDLSDYRLIEKKSRYELKDFPNGFNEKISINFHSPYGCSKGAADQYLQDYYRVYGVNSVVLRHSTMYGGNQNPTLNQGWIGWFIQKALEISKNPKLNSIAISGTGKQVRDVLHVSDIVFLYREIINNIYKVKGQVFNIGGGYKNSLSILELFKMLEEKLNIKIKITNLEWRLSDQKVFIADNSKISSMLGWEPKISVEKGINLTLDWFKKQ
jgi:CDP-paratose 2-epimerase